MSYYDRDYYRPSGFGGFSFFPPVIKNLLIINGAVFFLMMLMQNILFRGVPAERVIIHYFALMPIESGNFQIWQLVTYQFLHGGFSHILFNMFALWMFGVEIENSWGSKKFLTFYLISGIGAGLLHMFVSPILTGVGAPTIGASGSVYGIMIAFAMMFPERLIYLYFLIPIKAKYLITFLIIMEFMLVDSASSGVAHLAHLGGALVGFLYIMFDKNTNVQFKTMFKKKRSNPFDNTYSNTSYSSSTFYKTPSNKVEDADYYEIPPNQEITQEEIDKILDKISQSGYSGLSEREKKILFEASKRMK
ncbi:MAG: rhomboid family intramembrane serine protease [Ignavibacteriaceae bacterium]|nr:rhomboid family intramembrane serine protease [Ignavibacteriaceae bacterium]HRI47439.1 rhomboid family intramembrane serine protease [Ignavibacteriaceae bacterium]